MAKKELENFLVGFQEVLKTHTLKELSDALQSVLNSKGDKKVVIDFVIGTVCRLYKISPAILLGSSGRGAIQEARMVSYAVFHYDLQMSLRYIASVIYNRKNHQSVNYSLLCFKDLQPTKFLLDQKVTDKYREVQRLTIEHIVKNNQTKSSDENI